MSLVFLLLIMLSAAYASADYTQWDYTEIERQQGLAEILKLAENGDVGAMEYYARQVRHAGGYDDAVKWYKLAHKNGSIQAAESLAFMYDHTLRDPSNSATWYLIAARAGSRSAQSQIANFYERGYGIKKNLRNAQRWYQAAADQSDVYAYLPLAKLLARSSEKRDWEKAYDLAQQSAALVDSSMDSIIYESREIADALAERLDSEVVEGIDARLENDGITSQITHGELLVLPILIWLGSAAVLLTALFVRYVTRPRPKRP